MSAIIKEMTHVQTNRDIEFIRVNRDTNGNPRYVFHFSDICKDYARAIEAAKTIGGKKYRAKDYAGGIVIQSYSIDNTAKNINELAIDMLKARNAANEYVARQDI